MWIKIDTGSDTMEIDAGEFFPAPMKDARKLHGLMRDRCREEDIQAVRTDLAERDETFRQLVEELRKKVASAEEDYRIKERAYGQCTDKGQLKAAKVAASASKSELGYWTSRLKSTIRRRDLLGRNMGVFEERIIN